MSESENNKILDLINKNNIDEYIWHRHKFSSDVKDCIDRVMSTTKYRKYQNYETRQDFIKYMLEYLKKYYFIQ